MDWMNETMQQLQKGAFLMVNGNPMTIGWAQFGIIWGKRTFTVYVRESRFTHFLLSNSDTFTVSVPRAGTLSKELGFCGSHSGRDTNKMNALGASLFANQFGGQDGFSGCRFHIECRILFRCDLNEERVENEALVDRYYADGDSHTMYVGEILGVTEENE